MAQDKHGALMAQLHCGDTAPYCGDKVEKVVDAQGEWTTNNNDFIRLY